MPCPRPEGIKPLRSPQATLSAALVGHGAPLGDGLQDHRPEFELLQGALSAPQYYLILFWKMNFCHRVKSSYSNHYPISLTLGIRQAQRYTTSLQVDLGPGTTCIVCLTDNHLPPQCRLHVLHHPYSNNIITEIIFMDYEKTEKR